MKKITLILILLTSLFASAFAANDNAMPKPESDKKLIYVFPIREEIMPAAWRLTKKCLDDAQKRGAEYIIIDMNTYGGMVDVADSIRTAILNSPIPIVVFINNQAASAGALISIAADSIYMRSGASIGAATVVSGTDGQPVPDKYQSFMRGMMRSTAESHGKITRVIDGDSVIKWRRDPAIAEAMVDPSISISGVVDSSKVLTLTTNEALNLGYCEGTAESIDEVTQRLGKGDVEVFEYKKTTLDRIMGFLSNPIFQGLMLMLIIGGIYFELQSPGIGFPLAMAVLGALLYFSPLYFEGLVQSWEIIVFVIGVILLAVELFVIPGFGVFGISGIVLIVTGLSFAMIDNEILKYVKSDDLSIMAVVQPFLIVIISGSAATIVSIWLASRLLVGKSKLKRKLVLESEMKPSHGFVGHSVLDGELTGCQALVTTTLRPSGKVEIAGKYYDAVSIDGHYVDKGRSVRVIKIENGTLYCR